MPAYFTNGNAVANATGTLALSLNVGSAQIGNLAIAYIVDHATSGSSAAPTGWTLLTSIASANGRLQAFYKFIEDGSTTSWSFTGLTGNALGFIGQYSGVDRVTPVPASSSRDNASGTTGTTTITPTGSDALIVAVFAAYASASTWSTFAVATNPGTLTQHISATGTNCSLYVADKAQSGAAAATGASSATMGTPGNNGGLLFALKAVSTFTDGAKIVNPTFECDAPCFTAGIGIAPNLLAPAWGSFAMASGEVGEAYDMEWYVEGCRTPVTYSVVSGSLPPGLSLSSTAPALGKVTGTPTTAGNYSFTIRATNSLGTADQSFSITIAAEGAGGGSFLFLS